MAIIRRLKYADDEQITISQNGKYISVFSKTRQRRTDRTIFKMRIEDSTGKGLWGMTFFSLSPCEPTPTGGFVAYTTPHPRDLSGWHEPKIVPEPQPYGLQVYDNQGHLVLEGVDYYECRSGINRGSLSPNGKYLALIFRSIPEMNRESRGNHGEDKACLILFDIEEGIEQWRHYFEGSMPGGVVVGAEAERILCFVSTTLAVDGSTDSNYHLYLFDHNGKLIHERRVPGLDDIAPPLSLRLSPDGDLCAFDTLDDRVYAIDMYSGNEVWSWKPTEPLRSSGGLGIADDGRALIFAMVGEHRKATLERQLLYLAPEGNVIHQDDREFTSLVHSLELGLSKGFEEFWIVHTNILMKYRIEDELRGERR